ncbi:Eco57I restriction-modification methylase domain-containing protein [Streptomonospora algeriensis]|uniref:site-specific DNA-methyltransferase (adenine-specific) n=1 Tax=Streptomonospora algeriensis TaxID=995084 RepID=A0ABW3B9S1_9ACTN
MVQASPDLLLPSWVELITSELLGWKPRFLTQADRSGPGPHPDHVLTGPGLNGGAEPRLHLYRHPWGADLAASRPDGPSPVEHAAARCRRDGVPLALLTNGRLWALVHARPGDPASTAVFDADLWLEEPVLLWAFATLLAGKRVRLPDVERDGTTPTGSTAVLFARTLAAQGSLTEKLGEQVRQAVEVLVGETARIDRETGGVLLAHVSERDIYRGALTVLMRTVFLLYAEEQRLLPGDELYAEHYSVTRLYDQLERDRDRYGEEAVDRRAAAWPRLLALFTGIYHGAEHPDLRLPAYGGSLFDPGRFPWLEGVRVTDHVVLQVLDALLMLRPRTRKGVPTRISYKGLGVEDIGHIYEGLLEFSCLKVDEPYVGLIGKQEPELPLSELEEQYSAGEEYFLAWLHEQTRATPKQLKKALAAAPAPEQRAALHAAGDSDAELAERALPFWGLLRPDLRGEPAVFPAHSVLFTQVGERRKTGTHYTPRTLAEKVVEHTLAPLAHCPGPAEGADPGQWRVKPAEELLALKVVDPAMGSGAFLVSACRYLADRVVEAWRRDGVPEDIEEALGWDAGLDDLRLFAKRRVAASCLYGVDRDDMAVELAKLSLWLETLEKNKPFGFLDHALRCGDSLVGLVDQEQVRAFHTDPKRGRALHADVFVDIQGEIESVLRETARLRQRIEEHPDDVPEDIAEKKELLGDARERSRQLHLAADAVIGAALAAERYTTVERWWEDGDGESKKLGWQGAYDDLLVNIAGDVRALLDAGTYDFPAEQRFRERVEDWLTGDRDAPITPLHWALEFPEVMGNGGFDAVVGNPPFSGGQMLTGTIGTDVREYLVVDIASGKRGSADLCSYFLLRNLRIAPQGRTGIIATNTIAQGDTREVGLDQVVEQGWSVYRAVKSQVWPGTANVHVSLVWAGHTGEREKSVLEDESVRAITPSLDPASRVTGNPWRLVANEEQSFQGSNILGEGFLLEPEEAHALVERDPRNRDVLFPYLNGKDLNGRPDCSASRWVINFGTMSEEEAREYPEPFAIVERKVKPEREKNNDQRRRQIWWRFTRPTPELYDAISGLDKVLVIALTSRTATPFLVPGGQVFSHMLGVFARSDPSSLSIISSSIHYSWASAYASSLKGDLRYTPSDVYETFPQPPFTPRMSKASEILDSLRRPLMLSRNLGLTSLYNLVHEPDYSDSDIDRLRELHVEIDDAVAEAYGWDDLDLGHGHHATPQGTRWTVSPAARTEILDRLLELNFARHEEEVRKGIWPSKKRKRRAKLADKAAGSPGSIDGALFAPDNALF